MKLTLLENAEFRCPKNTVIIVFKNPKNRAIFKIRKSFLLSLYGTT